jgi:hypothetical protein
LPATVSPFSTVFPSYYSRLVSLRPLPVKAAAKQRQQDPSDEENEQFEDAQDQQLSETESVEEVTQPVIKKKKKSRKNRSSKHYESEAEEESPTRTPFSQKYINDRESQRLENHPTMAKTRAGSKKGSPAAKKRTSDDDKKMPASSSGKKSRPSHSDDSDSEASDRSISQARKDQIKELQATKLELYRLQKRAALEKQHGSRKKAKTKGLSTMDAEQNLVYNTAKTRLFKIAKFIADEKQLNGATDKVMKMLDLACFEGKRGKALIDAQEEWKANNREIVRNAINDWRNYVQSELHKHLFKTIFPSKREAELPTPAEMYQVALREGLNDDDPDQERMQECLDIYWDELLSKVAGHSSWGPGKRHHGCISDSRPGDNPDEVLYVTPSDEAFLVLVWENCYTKWMYMLEQERAGKDVDEKAEEYQTPFTVPKGGVQYFGGWNKAGRKRYRDILEKVKESKEENPDLKAIEKAALERIRSKHKCQEREDKRKQKGRKKDVEMVDSDHEADWMD